jgi:hypothetical protein
MNSTKTRYLISAFIERGLRNVDREAFSEWADDNVYKLAKIYENFRGEAYSLVDAVHVLHFVQTMCSMVNIDDTMEMTNHFIKCQFKDSVV